MNRTQLEERTFIVIKNLQHHKGYISPVDLMKELGVLSSFDEQEWRKGKVTYLERVIHLNLNQISFVMHLLRSYANQHQLKPSVTVYFQSKTKTPLCFSKSKDSNIEKHYRTHYIDVKRCKEIKEMKVNDKSSS